MQWQETPFPTSQVSLHHRFSKYKISVLRNCFTIIYIEIIDITIIARKMLITIRLELINKLCFS